MRGRRCLVVQVENLWDSYCEVTLTLWLLGFSGLLVLQTEAIPSVQVLHLQKYAIEQKWRRRTRERGGGPEGVEEDQRERRRTRGRGGEQRERRRTRGRGGGDQRERRRRPEGEEEDQRERRRTRGGGGGPEREEENSVHTFWMRREGASCCSSSSVEVTQIKCQTGVTGVRGVKGEGVEGG